MSARFQTKVLQKHDYNTWDVLVDESREGTVYHSTAWLSPVSDLAGCDLTIYGYFYKGHLVAGLPLQIRKKGPFTLAKRAFATPYAHVVRACDFPPSLMPCLVEAVQETSRKHSQTTLTANPFIPSLELPPRWEPRGRATYVLDIHDIDALWKRITPQLRNKISKARRRGIAIESGCESSDFFRLYNATFTRHGLRLPFDEPAFVSFLAEIQRRKAGQTFIARTHSGVPCAALLALSDQSRAYYSLAGIDVAATKAPASALLLWETICSLSRTHTEMDLVGANIPSVNRFKKQYCGTLTGYSEYTHYRTNPEKILLRLRDYLRGPR